MIRVFKRVVQAPVRLLGAASIAYHEAWMNRRVAVCAQCGRLEHASTDTCVCGGVPEEVEHAPESLDDWEEPAMFRGVSLIPVLDGGHIHRDTIMALGFAWIGAFMFGLSIGTKALANQVIIGAGAFLLVFISISMAANSETVALHWLEKQRVEEKFRDD